MLYFSYTFIDPSDHEALADFVRFEFGVLNVIASGNHGLNFDEVGYSEYPACIRTQNSIVVGGLAADSIEENKMASYQRSKMASYGVRCVDIMGPAENVEGAWLWPNLSRASGTSVAAPYVLNVLLKMHEIKPDFDVAIYREILLKTAYIPAVPFQVRSGGIVHPRRALYAMKLYSEGRSLEQAILKARSEIHDATEINDYARLVDLWSKNKLFF